MPAMEEQAAAPKPKYKDTMAMMTIWIPLRRIKF